MDNNVLASDYGLEQIEKIVKLKLRVDFNQGLDARLVTDEIAQLCGIDSRKMHAHAFRHFFAKMFLKKNKDVIQLADLLGHGSVDTTRIYLQKSYDEQKRDFNRNVTW